MKEELLFSQSLKDWPKSEHPQVARLHTLLCTFSIEEKNRAAVELWQRHFSRRLFSPMIRFLLCLFLLSVAFFSSIFCLHRRDDDDGGGGYI